MSLLTTTEIRQHIETDLLDAALQLRIDEAEAEIIARYGAHSAARTERFTPGPADEYIWTSRPIGAVTSIKERYYGTMGETEITLVADNDYFIESERQIRRKIGGSYPSTMWRGLVTVVFTPATADDARRKGVLIDLVKLALRYEGAQSTSMGDASVSHVDYPLERQRILSRLGSFSGSFA